MNFVDFLAPMLRNARYTTYTTNSSRPKSFDFYCKQYITWEYPEILAQKIMYQYLI